MTFKEAKEIFINRGYVPTNDGNNMIYDPDKWRDSVGVISRWLEQESCEFVKDINALSPVNTQPKTGHWIKISPTGMYCSECNEMEHLDTSRKFCAYCGTRMVEPPEEKG